MQRPSRPFVAPGLARTLPTSTSNPARAAPVLPSSGDPRVRAVVTLAPLAAPFSASSLPGLAVTPR